jgi:hypothetical protein
MGWDPTNGIYELSTCRVYLLLGNDGPTLGPEIPSEVNTLLPSQKNIETENVLNYDSFLDFIWRVVWRVDPLTHRKAKTVQIPKVWSDT